MESCKDVLEMISGFLKLEFTCENCQGSVALTYSIMECVQNINQ